jgi:hypothetical protein
MTVVSIRNGWFVDGTFYPPTKMVDIPGLEAKAKSLGKSVEDILPSGVKLVKGGSTPLPETHTAVTTLSEMAKIPARDAVSASHGPTVTISEEAMEGKNEAADAKAASPVKK